MVRVALRGLVLLCCLLPCRMSEAQKNRGATPELPKIRVAAAADLQFALDELGAQFEKRAARRIDVVYGSSGNFFAQIQNGAPFDVFLSADMEYPRKLESSGLAAPGTFFEYATGRIAIWMPNDAKVNLAQLGWKALLEPGVEKIAIANPDHAPYGRAVVAALRNAGIYEQVRKRLVYGENIAQAAQFAASGSAQAGILALSLAISPAMRDGQRWEIPADMHPPIEQGAVILKNANDKEGARAFMDFLKSDAAQKILQSHGFALPSAHAASAPRQ